jgi:hypothetical protein
VIGLRPALGALALGLAAALPAWPAAAQGTGLARVEQGVDNLLDRIDVIRDQLRSRGSGVLGLMGYNMTPDGSANSLTVNRSTVSADEGASTLTLSQFGFGFTWSESFPLFTELYGGYARYDPRAVFTGLGTRRSPLRWNNFAATLGVGYDIRIGEYLWLRPILNVSGGYAASDGALFGSFLEFRTDRDVAALTDQHVNVLGLGGSLMLAYYDYQPRRDIDVELRYTQIQLQTVGDTIRAARGRSTAQTAGLWVRYRWPTGLEAFGRPVRWVLDGTASYYFGDQAEVTGFRWAVKAGGGIEIDVGRYEVGAVGLYLSRLRLVARYFYGDGGVTGTSVGIGMSF